ncbi:hypothetical protein QTJ16_004188 [Diplocarpon rosae]|uniref:Uncharacterized protein n=1 Tax=Diplocarpon rosae TaxID=946125 RepID=A0AAD9T1B5_9HELO|nr:hypothetical protein QTJ16_004188 [Diplocarpon rosae]
MDTTPSPRRDTPPTHASASLNDDSKFVDDYSDIASEDAQGHHPPDRRRYPRGGRKTGSRRSSREELELLEGYPDSDGAPVSPSTCPYCTGQKATPPRSPGKSPPDAQPCDTGIRAFNIRRAAGGRRPVSVRPAPARQKPAATATATRRRRARATPRSDDEGDATTAGEGGARTPGEEKASEAAPPNAGAGRPMSIRLDLNLMVEVFLKAKIQGDVTVTFLYVRPASSYERPCGEC